MLPDETLVKKLGFTKKQVSHHDGKPRVFTNISCKTNQIALVDEDPGSPPHKYEKQLKFQKELHGVKYFIDSKRNNKVFVLKVKLEDWIISVCKKSNVDITKYGLPDKSNALHDIINYRLVPFAKLLDDLLQNENVAISTLKKWLTNQ